MLILLVSVCKFVGCRFIGICVFRLLLEIVWIVLIIVFSWCWYWWKVSYKFVFSFSNKINFNKINGRICLIIRWFNRCLFKIVIIV